MKLNSYQGLLTKEQSRRILTSFFRFPHDKVTTLLHEMHELGLIRLQNHKNVWILE